MVTTLNHGAKDCTKGEIVMYQPDDMFYTDILAIFLQKKRKVAFTLHLFLKHLDITGLSG
ncbi:MAG: hypothetical protein K6F78_05875 [Bacteroidaceae bacterium]|nr:hypothetical protein [Bacteroidaceae bacterium]